MSDNIDDSFDRDLPPEWLDWSYRGFIGSILNLIDPAAKAIAINVDALTAGSVTNTAYVSELGPERTVEYFTDRIKVANEEILIALKMASVYMKIPRDEHGNREQDASS